jgi:hypothetical protein
VTTLASQEAAEERRDIRLLGGDRRARLDGAEVLGHHAGRQAGLRGHLRQQRHRVLVGVLAAGPAQGQVQVPARRVRPERPPRGHGAVAGLRVAHEQERLAEAVAEHRQQVRAARDDRAVGGAVQVDAGLDPRVLVHGLGRGEPAGRHAEHADPAQVQPPGQPGRERRVAGVATTGQRGQVVQHEPGVGHPDVDDLFGQCGQRAVLLGLLQAGGQHAVDHAAAGELDLGGVVGGVDGHHHVAAAGQVLHQRGAPGAVLTRARGVEHDRELATTRGRRAGVATGQRGRPVHGARRHLVELGCGAVGRAEVRGRAGQQLRRPRVPPCVPFVLAGRWRRTPSRARPRRPRYRPRRWTQPSERSSFSAWVRR